MSYSKFRSLKNGYKTLKAKDIGGYAKVEYSLIEDERLRPSFKLVYAYLRSYMNLKTQVSSVSISLLMKKTGYSNGTINEAIKSLKRHGIIDVEKRASKVRDDAYSVYRFKINDERFAMISNIFLDSSKLTSKEKEFIILIFPYILENDTIGSVFEPVTLTSLAKKIGLTRATVSDRIESLKLKNLLFDYYSRNGGREHYTFVGYELNMKEIMLDNTNQIIKERNELYEIVRENGITYETKC
jgi:biotin operon repressor